MVIPTESKQAHYSSFPDTSFNILSTCTPIGDPILPPDLSPSVFQAAIGEELNHNLSSSQLELLGWHYHLCHVDMTSLQHLMSPTKALDRSDTKSHLVPPCAIATKQPNSHKCDIPKCAACCLANMDKLSPSTTHTSSTFFGILKQDGLHPGDCMSMDQYIVSQPGHTPSSSQNTLSLVAPYLLIITMARSLCIFKPLSTMSQHCLNSPKQIGHRPRSLPPRFLPQVFPFR